MPSDPKLDDATLKRWLHSVSDRILSAEDAALLATLRQETTPLEPEMHDHLLKRFLREAALPDPAAKWLPIVSAARDAERLAPEALIGHVYSAVDQAGFAFGLASAGPSERLRRFLEEELLPALAGAASRFEESVERRLAELRSPLGGVSPDEPLIVDNIKVFQVASTAQALQDLLPELFPELALDSFSAVEWSELALAYLMYRDSL